MPVDLPPRPTPEDAHQIATVAWLVIAVATGAACALAIWGIAQIVF